MAHTSFQLKPVPGTHAWKWIALGVTGLAVVIWLVSRLLPNRGFDWRAFGAILTALKRWWLAAAAFWVMAGYFVRALRWRVLIRPIKANPSLWNLFSATVIGFTAITVLGRPGEFARPYLIAIKEKVPVSSQLAVLVLERIYDMLVVLAIFGFALSRVRRSTVALGPALSWVLAAGGWLVGGLAVLILSLVVVFRHFSVAIRRHLLGALAGRVAPRYFKIADRLITAFVQGVESTKSRKSMLVALGYSALEWATIALVTFSVMRAFGAAVRFGWLDVLIFLGFLAFGAVVQIPGVGGGVQVVSVLVLTEMFRFPLELASSVALVLWFISFVVVVPVGVVLALHEGIHWDTLRQLEPEVTT